MRSPSLSAVLPVAISVAMLVLSSVMMSRSRALSRGGRGETTGYVDMATVRYPFLKGHKGVKLAYTVDGRDYHVAGKIRYEPGKKEYPVFYHKSDPERASTSRRSFPVHTVGLIIACSATLMSLDGMAREMGVLPPKR